MDKEMHALNRGAVRAIDHLYILEAKSKSMKCLQYPNGDFICFLEPRNAKMDFNVRIIDSI
jgi:flagellar biosynthesis/type III secretory pathway chaperone